MTSGLLFLTLLAAQAPETGSIKGIVKFEGPKPEVKALDQALGHAFCNAACGGKAPMDEKYLFGKNGNTLRNVLVYVTKGLEGKTFDPPKDRVLLDQKACVYTPHVVSLMVGQTLEVRNSDDTLHNVMASPDKNRPFNDGTSKGDTLLKTFDHPELNLKLRCFLHPWMQAVVHVVPHPFHALSGEDGTFELKGLPPGEVEISVRHESSRLASEPATLTVKIEAGKTHEIEFVYRDKKK